MSLQAQLNITEDTLVKYSPLDQLSPKYLSQTLKNSKVVIFEPGEVIFEKEHDLAFSYYLLAGKITAKKGLLSSTKIDSGDPICLHPINKLIPNGVSVKANTPGHLLLLDPKFIDRALAWSESEAREVKTLQKKHTASTTSNGPTTAEGEFDEAYFNWMTSLLEFPLFFNLPPSNITELFEKFERIKASKDEVIIKEGDDGDYFYLLIKGSASVLVGDGTTKVATLKPGAYFGEEALVSETVRSASVVMNEDSQLARLDKTSFQSLLHDPLVQYVTPAEYETIKAEAGTSASMLDIRSMTEFEHIPMPNCLHIPIDELRDKVARLDKSKTYYLSDDGGQRNEIAAHILAQNSIKAFVIRGR
ncbi:MAG: cyclic nucleotide-binding domain-containing protein [Hahellaceae bacterium]|nr:cyclic nucleotide-binding domain-containing protein [Hahellaceae bacterium]MCP5211378.1 cyclic nucleotide-binding domain-containing protein [Hahellaceae bacterium]